MLRQVTQFAVPTYDKPGALGKITDLLARKGYNIAGASTESMDDVFIVRFVADAEAGITEVLKAESFQVVETPALCIHLANKPGQLAEMAKVLGENNINIWHLYGTTDGAATAKMVLTCDNPEKAKNVLAKIAEVVTPNP